MDLRATSQTLYPHDAQPLVFLASPAASLITGAHLVTDGGVAERIDF
jgi:NAD(P)-dependent dehydrogenase (short-subunit alcohol dehydrogenase family)